MHVCPRQTDHRRGACQQREITTSLCAEKSVRTCTCKILQINRKYDKFAASAGCADGKSFSASGAKPLDPPLGALPPSSPLGAPPPDSIIGSRYRTRHSPLYPHSKFRSDTPDLCSIHVFLAFQHALYFNFILLFVQLLLMIIGCCMQGLRV